MTSFDGTVVSTVTDCNKSTETQLENNSQDTTLKSNQIPGSDNGGTISPVSSQSSSQLRKHTRDILRQVFVPDIGMATEVKINIYIIIKCLLLHEISFFDRHKIFMSFNKIVDNFTSVFCFHNYFVKCNLNSMQM